MSSLTPRPLTPSGTTLSIDDRELDRLHDHAVDGHPYEVVGILAGSREGARVTRAVRLENATADDPSRRFHVSGLTLMRAENALEADGLDVLGYYHSHPDHPANWSDTDRDQALPNLSYVIVAVHGKDGPEGDGERTRVTDTRAWRLRDDRSAMDHEVLRILPSSSP